MNKSKLVISLVLAFIVLASVTFIIIVAITNKSRVDYYRLYPDQLKVAISKAEKGDVASCWKLVNHYDDMGDSTYSDYWLRKAALYGDTKAMLYISHREKWKKDPESQKKAEIWLKRAAEKGNSDAQEELKNRSRNGS